MKTSLTGLNRRTKTLLAVTGVVLLIAVGVYSVWTTQADLRLLVLRQVGRALPGSSIETCIACQASCNYNEPSDSRLLQSSLHEPKRVRRGLQL